MIFDYENMFLCKKAVSSYDTTEVVADHVVSNNHGGNAFNRPVFVVWVTGAALGGGDLTITLQTSDDESFSSGVVDLAAYTVLSGSQGQVIAANVPMGAKKYLRLKLKGSDSITGDGVITAALVTDHNMIADL